jgi:hypothetical protein
MRYVVVVLCGVPGGVACTCVSVGPQREREEGEWRGNWREGRGEWRKEVACGCAVYFLFLKKVQDGRGTHTGTTGMTATCSEGQDRAEPMGPRLPLRTSLDVV